jgi:hypothetical protein
MLHDKLGHRAEEAGQPEVGDHDHYAEQQNDGVVIDGSIGLAEIQNAESDHKACADNARPCTIYAKAGEVTGGQDQINGEEDKERAKDRLYATGATVRRGIEP